MNKILTNKILDILKEEVVPAEGCTEPIAIAYVASKATEILGEKPEKVNIYVSGNMIKNVKSVTVPNSGGMVGIEVACAMGIVCGKSEDELMVISNISKEQLEDVKNYINNHEINVIKEDTNIKLYVRIEVISDSNIASVEIKHTHTNITKISKNGKTLIERICNDADFNSPLEDRELLSIELIYNIAKKIDVKHIENLFDKVIEYNGAIAKEGLRGTYGINIGKIIEENIKKGFYGNDLRNRCASFTASGSDARMSGCPLPVMTTSGSGNQGMTASLPIIKYCSDMNISKELTLRTLLFSHLATIHIKTNVGRLSAYCGVICASAAVSGAITFLQGGSYVEVAGAITNTLGNISGVVCDGAKASCAMKIATGITAAFDSSLLAMNSKILSGGDGIIGNNVEETIENIGNLSQKGMQETDDIILSIMTK